MKCELLKNPLLTVEVFVSHRNAPLSETGRLRLARCVVEDRWPLRRAAERFQVSVTTASRCARRYRELGEAAMVDLNSSGGEPRAVASGPSGRRQSMPMAH